MKAVDMYTQIKMETVAMSLSSVHNLINIMSLPLYQPSLLDDEYLFECFSRILDIHEENKDSIVSLMSYIGELGDINSDTFSNELLLEYNYIKDNFYLEKTYFDNIIKTIDLENDHFKSKKDKIRLSNDYLKTDNLVFDEVQVNYALIKEMRRERRIYFE